MPEDAVFFRNQRQMILPLEEVAGGGEFLKTIM